MSVDVSQIVTYFCVAPRSAAAQFRSTADGPLGAVLGHGVGSFVWENKIGVSPPMEAVVVVEYPDEAQAVNLHDVLTELGIESPADTPSGMTLGGKSVFYRSLSFAEPGGKAANVLMGFVFRDDLGSFVIPGDGPATFLSGARKNPVAIMATQSLSIATQVTEHANKPADSTPVTLTSDDLPRPSVKGDDAPVLRVSVHSMKGHVSKVRNRYRFQIRVEGDNASSIDLDWSGVTINVPTINSREKYLATEIQMSSVGCNAPSKYGPGDQIWGFRDDGTFGEKVATSLLLESVRQQWPPHERIALEAVLLTSCNKLDLYVRVWSTNPDTRDGFGDPDWKAATQKDQQGISAYAMSLRFGAWDRLKYWFLGLSIS